ncbi:MAG: hypothetical protein ACYDHC_05195 [Desulfuromonadaceae bacterium]
MKRKWKNKIEKDIFSICALPPDLEMEARDLHSYVLCGAEPLLNSWQNPAEMLKQPEFRRAFYSAAHHGFHKAQHHIIESISNSSESPLSAACKALYRKIMDTAAWQMLDMQLYVARRLYQDQKPPSLEHSNFRSVQGASLALTSPDYAKFALISDLTSFVQVGDLLVMDADAGLAIVEVKEGEKNKKLMEFAHFLSESKCERALHYFSKEEGVKSFEQLGRMLRQNARMSHVEELMNSGMSRDPDTDIEFRIPDDPLPLNTYDDCLTEAIESSKAKGWAIAHVDDCLFIGAYRDKARLLGKEIFRLWFEQCGGKEGFPITNLISCMQVPLALPVFSREIPREHMFDILFGRVVVYLGINMDAFIELCRANGLDARWSTRKEAAKLHQQAKHKAYHPWTFNNQALLVGSNNNLGPISDGLFVRMLFHGTSPLSAVALLQATRKQE